MKFHCHKPIQFKKFLHTLFSFTLRTHYSFDVFVVLIVFPLTPYLPTKSEPKRAYGEQLRGNSCILHTGQKGNRKMIKMNKILLTLVIVHRNGHCLHVKLWSSHMSNICAFFLTFSASRKCRRKLTEKRNGEQNFRTQWHKEKSAQRKKNPK